MLHPRLIAVTALALSGLLLSSCGDEGVEDSADKLDGAEQVMTAHLAALSESDYATACDHFAPDYRTEVVAQWQGFGDGEAPTECAEALAEITEFFAALAEVEGDAEVWAHADLVVESDGEAAIARFALPTLDETTTYRLEHLDGTWFIVGADAVAGDADVDDTPENGSGAASTSDGPEASQTVALGEEVNLLGWEVTVTEVDFEADAAIAAADEGNAEAAGRYALVTFYAAFAGDQSDGSADALIWSFTDGDGVTQEPILDVITPAVAGGWKAQAEPGETLQQQVVFDLAPGSPEGGRLHVEYTGDDGVVRTGMIAF